MSANVTVTFSGPVFDPSRPRYEVLGGMDQAVKLLETRVKQKIPIGPGRFGHLVTAIRHGSGLDGTTRVVGRVWASGPAAFKMRFVEGGTAAHVIKARRKGKELAFGSPMTFRASVRHPGSRAQQPLHRSLDESVDEIGRMIGAQLAKGLNGR